VDISTSFFLYKRLAHFISEWELVSVDGEVDVVKTIMDLMSQLPGDQYANAMKTVLGNIRVDFDWRLNFFFLVKMLVQAGADTNATNIDTGETLLQWCVIGPNIDRRQVIA
jgi:hypothetical protein